MNLQFSNFTLNSWFITRESTYGRVNFGSNVVSIKRVSSKIEKKIIFRTCKTIDWRLHPKFEKWPFNLKIHRVSK